VTALATRPALRAGPVSVLWRPRHLAVVAVLAVAALAVLTLNVARGDFALSPTEVLGVLAGGGSRADRVVVLDLRLPRSLAGLLVGAALGAAGAITASVARNPLATPDVLGISAGAGAAAVAVLVLGGATLTGTLGVLGLPLAALGGGLATAALLYLLAWRDGVEGVRLVLVGVGLAAALTAVTSYLLLLADTSDAALAKVWLTGSLNGLTWLRVLPVAVAVALVGVLAVAAAPTLALLRMGGDTARALGLRLQTGQAVLLGCAVVLASVATATAGPVAFVALLAPQVALRLTRAAGPPLVASALVGAVVVVGSDLVARTVLPVELPVGVVTAAIGGPFLLHLLVVRSREASA
jgi:iron complex transport system permease protein